MKKFKIEHVNTGCLYEARGQLITILHGKDKTHFFDHSRMVDGTIDKVGLSAIEVVGEYVKGNYGFIDLEPEVRVKAMRMYADGDFKDISTQYRSRVIWGW